VSGAKNDIIAVIMDVVNTPEASMNFYKTTRHNIPEDSHLNVIQLKESGYMTINAERLLSKHVFLVLLSSRCRDFPQYRLEHSTTKALSETRSPPDFSNKLD
jgi:hypothetical protein